MGDIFKERQQRCWWGDGVCACRKDRKSKDIGAVGLQGGQVCLKKSLLLPKRQDSDKLSCLCRQPPCHTHTHTKTSTHRVTTHQWNEWTASVWHVSVAGVGGRGDGSCSPTKRRWCDGAARDRMLNCFGVNNLLSAHESWFPYLWEGLSTPALYSPFCLLITTCIIHLYSFKAMNNNNWFITMLLVLNKQILYIYLSNPTEHYC